MSVSAAPNRCAIRAHVVAVRQDERSPDKWNLRLAVEQVQPLEGGTFVEAGDEVDAWIFGPRPETGPGDRITADAEYVGGPFAGALRLLRLASAE